MNRHLLKFVIAATVGLAPAARAADHADYWQLDAVATPGHLSPEVGGMDTLADGRIAVAMHSGEVYLFNPANQEWKLFAAGLHDPLGLAAISDEVDELLDGVLREPDRED